MIGLYSKYLFLKLLRTQFLKVSPIQSINFTSKNLIKSEQTFAATTLDKKLYEINHSIFFVCCVTLNPVIHNSLWILHGIKFTKGFTCTWCKWKTAKGSFEKCQGRGLVVLEIQSRKGFWMFSFRSYLWVSKCHNILMFLKMPQQQ